jgi:hypothetical protein
MRNTKKIVTTLLVSILGLSSLSSVSASYFDCTTIDRETMKEIMDKQNEGTTLTTSELELLEDAKECKPEGKRNGKSKMN